MKKLIVFICICLFACQAFSQIRPQEPDPFLFRAFTHSGNLKSTKSYLQMKSFYQSKADWQTIIDTTWGPGRPLNEKLAVFDTYTGELTKKFAGFNSLGIDPAEWDSIKASYRSRIDSSTSLGAFAALMSHLAYDLRDVHCWAWDTKIYYTSLDPGIPVLVIGTIEISHFGAVLTVLPDSSLLVLRTVDDHPLGLQPGDIVLGYEGVPWKDLVDELLASGIPFFAQTAGSKSASRYLELASAGMNWHLFETIDIVKYEDGDTVHLPVYPMVNLPVPPEDAGWWGFMWNNEQLPVPHIPFPDPKKFDERSVTYGIVEGTNIGYIYLYAEVYDGYGFNYTSDGQFYEAVKNLSGTEGLIIDLRYNFGGWSLFDKAFNLLFNTRQPTLEDAKRCNQTDFSLCPVTDYSSLGILAGSAKDPNLLFIPGNPMSWYDRPLAILTGPNCGSDGDITAYRFGYHPFARFFGKSPRASLSYSWGIGTYPDWILNYSRCDMYHVNDPNVFLCGREFPVDDNVWFDAESAAAGRDTVVGKAIDWIRNLSYAHNVKVNPGYATPGTDTVTITAEVINPNEHELSVSALITSMDSIVTETVELFNDGNHNDGEPGDSIWGMLWQVPDKSTMFSADVTTEDLTAGTSRTITGAVRFTTIGDTICDERLTDINVRDVLASTQTIYYTYTSAPENEGAVTGNKSTSTGIKETISIKNNLDNTTDQAQRVEYEITPYIMKSDNSIGCPGSPVKVEIWVEPAVRITAEDDTVCDGEQTNIELNSLQKPTREVFYTYTSTVENSGAVIGNSSDTEPLPVTAKIQDTLRNVTEQMQRVIYKITPYVLKSDNSIGCSGSTITVYIWVDTLNVHISDISVPVIARIYPNPASELINIEIRSTVGQETEIELLTITGQVIYRKDYRSSRDHFTEQIDLSGYARGMYFVRVRQSGAVYNGKIIVQ